MTQKELIPHLFRTEYSKIIAVLCKIFGLSNMQIAEDIVSDTFLLAAETWGIKGVPENQVGWLYTVAKNKTKDYLKRNKLYAQKIERELKNNSESEFLLEIDLSEKNITDSQLQMLFAICNPSISAESQIGLALRILCGFGIDEIAEAFLSKKETINKRLFRAKESLRKKKIKIEFPKETKLLERLDNVLRVLYLLFNEGYYSATQNKTLRKDFCMEAMRLTLMLVNNTTTCKPKVNALFSLMCFHASRFESRIDYNGAFILYQDQDVNLWDDDLIQKGTYYLNRSSVGEVLSKYHLEAAIAYWHTQKKDDNEKWENILQLYNYLLQIEYSPVAALNRTYALARANGTEKAIIEAEKINLKESHLYHCLLADLYKTKNIEKAVAHLEMAYDRAKSVHEKTLVKQRIQDYRKLGRGK